MDLEKHKKPYFYFTLKIGVWKNQFTEFEYKVILAKSLTACVAAKKPLLIIKGYIITKRRISLVLDIKDQQLVEFLNQLYKQVKYQIWIMRFEKEGLERTAYHENELDKEFHHPLFEKSPLYNMYLIQLLLGKKVQLPYHNPHIERLKAFVRKSEFCSAIDYTGAVGPVVLKPYNE